MSEQKLLLDFIREFDPTWICELSFAIHQIREGSLPEYGFYDGELWAFDINPQRILIEKLDYIEVSPGRYDARPVAQESFSIDDLDAALNSFCDAYLDQYGIDLREEGE